MDAIATNLLPPERLRALERERVVRSWVAGLWATCLFVALNILLLLPAYAYVSTRSPAQDSSELGKASALEENFRDMLAYTHEPRVSRYLRAVFKVPHPGIQLTAFTYEPPEGGLPAKLTLSGEARTREDLLGYDSALKEVDGIERARIPVSAYSRDTDIRFTFDIDLTQ